MRNARPGRFSFVASAAVLVALVALLPLGFVLWIGIQSGWDMVASLVFRPRVAELLVNTALLVLVTVPLCVGLALALAWLTERSDLPGARTWAWLAVAPLAVPAFVHSYAWITLLPLETILRQCAEVEKAPRGELFGVFFGSFYPSSVVG